MSLRYAVLGIIQHKPQHGYEIKQAIEASFGAIWNVPHGQLYPTLKNLTEKGLVQKHKEQGQKSLDKNVYEITEQGREVLEKWLLEMPKKVPISGKDEFALLYLFQFLLERHGKQREAVERQELYFGRMKDKYESMYRNLEAGEQAKKVLLRRILLRIEAEITWLEELKSNTF